MQKITAKVQVTMVPREASNSLAAIGIGKSSLGTRVFWDIELPGELSEVRKDGGSNLRATLHTVILEHRARALCENDDTVPSEWDLVGFAESP